MDGALGKAPLGGELTGPNPTDRAKKGRSDRSSPRARASRSGSPGGREPQRLQARRADDRIDPDRAARADSGSAARAVPRQGLRLPRGVRARRGVRFTAHVRGRGEEARRSSARPASVPAAGSSSAPTPGSTASAASSPAGRNAPTPTSRCSTSPAA